MYDMNAVFVHDAAALAAVVRPDLFKWETGKVLVVSEGPVKGKTVMDECRFLCFLFLNSMQSDARCFNDRHQREVSKMQEGRQRQRYQR